VRRYDIVCVDVAMYSVRRFGASMVEVDFNTVVMESLRYVPSLRLKTLDLLHIAAAKLVGA